MHPLVFLVQLDPQRQIHTIRNIHYRVMRQINNRRDVHETQSGRGFRGEGEKENLNHAVDRDEDEPRAVVVRRVGLDGADHDGEGKDKLGAEEKGK